MNEEWNKFNQPVTTDFLTTSPPFNTTQHFSNHRLVLNSLLSSDSAAAFMHHFSILQIHAIILLTDNQSCVSVCLANSSSFHVNFPYLLLDQQTHCPVHILLEHHHKIMHLTISADDSTYQVKHRAVKFCGPKCFMVVKHWMFFSVWVSTSFALIQLFFCLIYYIYLSSFCNPKSHSTA